MHLKFAPCQNGPLCVPDFMQRCTQFTDNTASYVRTNKYCIDGSAIYVRGRGNIFYIGALIKFIKRMKYTTQHVSLNSLWKAVITYYFV